MPAVAAPEESEWEPTEEESPDASPDQEPDEASPGAASDPSLSSEADDSLEWREVPEVPETPEVAAPAVSPAAQPVNEQMSVLLLSALSSPKPLTCKSCQSGRSRQSPKHQPYSLPISATKPRYSLCSSAPEHRHPPAVHGPVEEESFWRTLRAGRPASRCENQTGETTPCGRAVARVVKQKMAASAESDLRIKVIVRNEWQETNGNAGVA